MRTLEEVEVLSNADRELLVEIKSIVRRFLPTAKVLLFGSLARGTQHGESDYDILVLTEKTLTPREQDVIRNPIFDLEVERGAVICTVVYSKKEWDESTIRVSPFHKEVERDAIVL